MMEAEVPWNVGALLPQHHHEHASDGEADDASDRRSFSDDYDSRRRNEYRMQHLNSHHQETLIHRHVPHKEEEDDERRHQTIPRLQFHVRKHRRKRWCITYRRIGAGLAAAVLWYAWAVLFRGSQVLHRHDATLDLQVSPKSRKAVVAAREQVEQARIYQRKRIEAQRRTRPAALGTEMEPNEFHLLDVVPRRRVREVQALHPAKLEELCGLHARNASLLHGHNYASRDALNSKSRVLITGILNPIGFHLALALQERCGVEVIAGIDPMFPNTVKHRMAMQERIQLLVTNIPKLIQPIALPLVGLDQRLNKDKKFDQETLHITGEVSLLNMKPTHIVHLASYSASEYAQGDFVNEDSPYGGHSDMHRIRSNAVAMEHVLSSLVTARAEQPHFSYASSATVTASNDGHARCKLTDEILADTYYSINGTFSVGVRLPDAVYGPWGRPGTLVYQMAEAAIGHGPLMNETQDLKFDFSYVDDVVDAIIAAMQYRSPKPAVFDLSSGSTHTVSTVANVVANLMPAGTAELSSIPAEFTSPNRLVERTRDLLQWEPTTSLVTGLAKTVAWHLDHAYPFGGNDTSAETGDEFRIRMKLVTCSADDVLCHLGPTYLPCVSECSTRDQCTPSIFDTIYDVVRDVTQECDVILYTQSIGYDVGDLNLQATYTDKEETMVCNFAFVPKDSRLVQTVVDKIPESQLGQFKLVFDAKESAHDRKEKKLKALNGRLLYKGWILIWVHDAIGALSESDRSLLKMSPGSFFASDVAHALFVDEHFSMSPSREDVLFLVSQTRRPKMPSRVVRRRDEFGKKHKYRLPAEAERRAAMLLSPTKVLQTNTGDAHHVTVIEATKAMQVENGEDVDAKETQGVKRQREFYERVPTFVNRVDMRSPKEPWYRYELNQWTRSKWVVHDLKLAEGRHLRCDWYQEHVQWGNNLDQLSFAHVLAKRTLARRIAHNEPDDHIKPAYVLHPELLQLTDGHEWHAMESEGNRRFQIHPMDAMAKLPDHMMDKDEEEGTEEVSSDGASAVDTKAVPLFVRIISEQVMMLERRSWSAAYAKYKANKKRSDHHRSS